MNVEERNPAAGKHFQDTARGWTDRYVEGNDIAPMYLVRRLAVKAQLEKALGGGTVERALDLGCGTGPYLPLLAAVARKVTGVDVAPAMIEEARKNLPAGTRNVELVCASALELPFPSDHFGAGVCVGVLEYFEHPEAVLREAFRVMKPGAPVVFTLPNLVGVGRLSGIPRTLPLLMPPRWKVRLGDLGNRLLGREADPSRYYLGASYTRGQVERLFATAGLQVTDVLCSGYDNLRAAGVRIPRSLDARLSDAIETRRDRFPWNRVGNNLIVTARK